MEAAVTIKGQVVIPAKIRERLGIKKGTRLHVEEREWGGYSPSSEQGIFPENERYPEGRRPGEGLGGISGRRPETGGEQN